MFFHSLRDAWKIFTNIANQQSIPGDLCCWPLGPLCSSLQITRAMIGGNLTTNQSLEKKKALCFNLFGSKTTLFPVFSL